MLYIFFFFFFFFFLYDQLQSWLGYKINTAMCWKFYSEQHDSDVTWNEYEKFPVAITDSPVFYFCLFVFFFSFLFFFFSFLFFCFCLFFFVLFFVHHQTHRMHWSNNCDWSFLKKNAKALAKWSYHCHLPKFIFTI